MLRYVDLGIRWFGDHPMPAHPRLNWEFLAVVRGKLAPFESYAKSTQPVSNRCWLFPPGAIHGWTGEQGKSCDVVVLHFSSIPRSIEAVAAKHRCLEATLTPADRQMLVDVAPLLQRHYWKPTLETDILAERALMDLCLLVLREYDERDDPQAVGGSYDRVVQVEQWLRDHLGDNPSIHAAAHHVGISISQCARLFSRIRKESPQQCLKRLKIERAMELLRHSNAKLEKVAAECGFSNASNLCRAFKAARGSSPTEWRRETYIRYRTPRPGGEAEYWQHGERVRPTM